MVAQAASFLRNGTTGTTCTRIITTRSVGISNSSDTKEVLHSDTRVTNLVTDSMNGNITYSQPSQT